jgi:hypothetical protein
VPLRDHQGVVGQSERRQPVPGARQVQAEQRVVMQLAGEDRQD